MSLSIPTLQQVARPVLARLQALVRPKELTRLLLAAAALLLLSAWASVGVMLHLKERGALDDEIRQNTNLARALEEQTVRVFASTDQATGRVRDAVVAGHQAPLDLARFASETGLVPNILVQLSVIDAAGRFVASNLDPNGQKNGHVDLSAREHVRVHLAPASLTTAQRLPNPDDLFIGNPVLGKVSQQWTIQLSRRIAAADGTLLGVVVASLDPAYFEAVYQRVALGTSGGVTLVGTDFGVRARVIGGLRSRMGSSLGASSIFGREASGTEGHFVGPSSLDGVDRITAYRRVASYPLYLLVATARDEALADWRETRNVTLALTLLLSGAVALGAVIFTVGVRRLERSNDALQVSEAQANSASQAKTEFLAAISHELRTPLTSIRGVAELMEHRLDQPVFREQAGMIRKGAEHLNALLTGILDLAKVEAGAMPLANQPVNLRALLQGSSDFLALAGADKGVELKVQLAGDLPETLVCDGLRLKQVLNNLLSNAVKFTPQGSVTIRGEVAGHTVHIHVDDTGPGIPQGKQQLIFEKFRQGDARVSYQHGGTGLGLALSRALAELMDGSLTVASAPGQGARFTVSLPMHAQPTGSR